MLTDQIRSNHEGKQLLTYSCFEIAFFSAGLAVWKPELKNYLISSMELIE